MADPTGRVISWLSVAALAMTLGGGGRAGAADAEVADGGGLFSDEARSEAGDIILAIQSQYGRDVRVETYGEVPEQLKARLERDGQDKFYDDWLNRRAKALGVRGVFVLVTPTPGRVQGGGDQATQRRGVLAPDRGAPRGAVPPGVEG